MISSIGKFSKSFSENIYGYNCSSFYFMGHGRCFRSGKQNIIAEINNKISSKEFMNFIQAVNITKEDIQQKV